MGLRPGCPLGLPPKDYDLTTSALPEETQRVFAALPPVSRPACATAPSPSCWRGEPLEITTYRVDGVYPTPATQMGSPSPAACARTPPGGTLPSTPWPTPPRGCRTSSGAGGPGPGDHPGGGQGGDPLSRGCPAHPPGPAVCFRAGLHPGGGDPPGRPGLRPSRWRPSRRSGCSANWVSSSAAKPPGGCRGPIPQVLGAVVPEILPMVGGLTSGMPTTATMWDPHRRGGGPRAPELPSAWPCSSTTSASRTPFPWGRMARGTSTATPGGAWSRRRPSSPAAGAPGRCGRPSCSWCYHDAVLEESPQRVRRWSHKLGAGSLL